MRVLVKLDPNFHGGWTSLRREHDDVAMIAVTRDGSLQLDLAEEYGSHVVLRKTYYRGQWLGYEVEADSQHAHEDEGPRHVCPVCDGAGVLDENEVNYDAVLEFASGFGSEEQE